MKLKKVNSGGQTGADRTGLECAAALGLKTGGVAPKGYRTENGPDPSLKDFGLIESRSENYSVRTRENVRDAQATIWFGRTDTPGYYCTKNAANSMDRPFFINPGELQLEFIAATYETINIAGNRRSKNPGVVVMVQSAFKVFSRMLQQK